MTLPAARTPQSSLETVLLDVHATLADLIVASDEQYAAVVARDLDRLESVTCQQEALSTRLAQAEAKRFDLLSGEPLSAAAAASEPVQQLSDSIAASVVQLKERQALTASLLEQSVQLAGETIEFLQRLVSSADSSSYSPRGRRPRRPSLLVDSRA